MADFLPAFRKVIGEEGGFSDEKHDRGGPTKYGITQRTLAEWWRHLGRDGEPTRGDVQILTETEAREIYRTLWWGRYGLGRITEQTLATKIFDMAVNMGPHAAVVIAQRAVGAVADGALGPKTIAALALADPEEALAKMRELAAERYRKIVAEDPTQERFLSGWLARAAR